MKIYHNDRVDIVKAYTIDLIPMIELANKYNVTRQAIYKILKNMGVDTSKKLIKVSCSACGEIIERNKSRIRKQRNHFCNYECYHAFLDAGNGSIYISNRQGQRIARKIVSHFFDLQNDHIVHHEDRNNFNNLPNNLRVFACQGDHIRYHRGFDIEPIWNGSKLSSDIRSTIPT